jgi:hypothetical protein
MLPFWEFGPWFGNALLSLGVALGCVFLLQKGRKLWYKILRPLIRPVPLGRCPSAHPNVKTNASTIAHANITLPSNFLRSMAVHKVPP